MTYKVIYHKGFFDELHKLDISVAEKILDKVQHYLVQDPIHLGKSLTGNYKGYYRYRYGNYRVLYKVLLQDKTIRVYSVKHRKEVYQ